MRREALQAIWCASAVMRRSARAALAACLSTGGDRLQMFADVKFIGSYLGPGFPGGVESPFRAAAPGSTCCLYDDAIIHTTRRMLWRKARRLAVQ